MAVVDYRLNPFLNVMDVKKITSESHQIPTQSPYTIRLVEVPQKSDPSSVTVKFVDGTVLTEVAAQPSQGQYWPDYNTTAHGVTDWNTGTLLFNSADAGKTVTVSYYGTGTLVDDRLSDMLEISVTSSTQRERNMTVTGTSTAYDNSEVTGKGNIKSSYVLVKQHTGVPAGTYTLKQILQQLINRSQTLEFTSGTKLTNCNCDCDCGDDGGSGS
jgi:hypothetical protein